VGDEWERMIKLDSNENPYGPSPLVLFEIRRHSKEVNRYPLDIGMLEERIAEKFRVDKGCVLVAAGGDRILDFLFRVCSKKGKRFLIPVPSFQIYEMLLLKDVYEVSKRFFKMPINRGGEGTFYDEVRRGDIIVLASPNNPDGRIWSEKYVRALCEKAEVIILDEAYMDYLGRSLASLTEEYENLVVVKTFSKLYALANLRVGYLIGDIARDVRNLATPYEVSGIGVKASLAALKDEEYYKRIRRLTKKNYERLYTTLIDLGFETYGSLANFVLIKEKLDNMYEKLRKEGVLVRLCERWRGLEGRYLRISVGTGTETEILLRVIRRIKKNE